VGRQARERVIEPAGYQVYFIGTPGVGSDPGEHWAQNQINGFLLILQGMGLLTIFLSSGLVINTISAILAQQIKQIGIMRSVGAVRGQIVGMYLVMVLVFSLLGLVIAIPLGLIGSWWLSDFAAGFLNFDIGRVDLSPQVLALQLALGLLMPVGVALVPVLAGTRISVYHAIYQYGLGERAKPAGLRALEQVPPIEPAGDALIAQHLPQKARLAFTIVTLTLAGAMFIAVFSTRLPDPPDHQIGRYIAYDAALSVPEPTGAPSSASAARARGELRRGWAYAEAIIEQADGSQSGSRAGRPAG
jgi:putative ABC transport system permease protein